MTDQSTFNDMSVLLTGFASSIITPQIDPIGLPGLFFQTAQTGGGSDFNALLLTFSSLKSGGLDDQAIGSILMGLQPDPSTSQQIPQNQTLIAQAILKLWYLGSWYQPFELSGIAKGAQTVVSNQSYIKGLAWQSMQSHAMGNSTFTFGYWNEPPAASLQDTTGNPNVSDGQTAPTSNGWA